MTNIVICFDGTWDDPTEKTNVLNLFSLLPGDQESVPHRGPVRSHLLKRSENLVAFYLEGVGAHGRERGILGGGLGIGLHDRVIDAFVLVSQQYEPGDKIWIFGFSRGAWSARSLGGFIASSGLLTDAAIDAADRAEYLWIDYKHGKTSANGNTYWEMRDAKPIKMIGVWDTVGALGIPFFNGMRAIDQIERRLFDFADANLSTRVEYGAQALAIDETRFDFTPTLWNPRANVTQVWFAGVHADIGGGYVETGLSDVALAWMIGQVNALHAGIVLAPKEFGTTFAPDPLQNRHDEARNKVWQLRPREARSLVPDACLHSAVIERLRERSDYRPAALQKVAAAAAFYAGLAQLPVEHLQPLVDVPMTHHLELGESHTCDVFAQNWWNASGLEVLPGERYRIAAVGQWSDRNNHTDANGYDSSSAILHLLEGTRRVEAVSWFGLIAAIHPEASLEASNPTSGNMVTGAIESARKHVSERDGESQLHFVGGGAELSVGNKGCLYFFANDSAFAYSNNSGFLTVMVERVG